MGLKGSRPACSIIWDFEHQARRPDKGLEGSGSVCSANIILIFTPPNYIIQQMSERPKKVWEILNVIPLIELQNASPEQLAEIYERADREEQQSKRFQRLMNKPISEVFGSEHSKKPS